MDRGWVKLYRKSVDWEWYRDPPTAHLFQHLVLTANRKDGKWRGQDIPAGSLVTSIRHLADQTGLSERQVRTALKHLVSTQDVTQTSTPRYTILKVNNYISYQDTDTTSDTVPTQYRHSTDTLVTTNKNERMKEVKKKEDIRVDFDSPDPLSSQISEVISYLNQATGKRFKDTTKANTQGISARLKEGATVEEMKKVIDVKTAEWGNNAELQKNLNPVTLFRPGNYERYVNQADWKPKDQRQQDLQAMQEQYGGTWL